MGGKSRSEDVLGHGMHIVSSIQFGRVEIPKGGHKISKGRRANYSTLHTKCSVFV